MNAVPLKHDEVFNQKPLTDRERQILILVAHEYTTNMIAQKLFLSPHTVISHRNNLMSKLDVSNTAGLVRRGFEIGILSLVPNQGLYLIGRSIKP